MLIFFQHILGGEGGGAGEAVILQLCYFCGSVLLVDQPRCLTTLSADTLLILTTRGCLASLSTEYFIMSSLVRK